MFCRHEIDQTNMNSHMEYINTGEVKMAGSF